MGAHGGPDIITDGLICYIDPSNPKSYSGSGTTVNDLTGNENNATLVNGVSYSSDYNGVFVLDGVNDYIQLLLNLTTTDHTICGAARYVTIGGRTFSGLTNNWLMGHWSSSTVKHYARSWVTSSSNSVESDTDWRSYVATGNYTNDLWGFYVNGSLNTSNSGGSYGPNNFAIGSYGGVSEFSNSQIGFMCVYNRVLSASEIQQNYAATRGRYGV